MSLPQSFNANEYSSWILSQGSPHNCIIVAGIKGGIEFELLQNAINLASMEQAMLRYSIAGDVCGFVEVNQAIPTREIDHENDWRKIAEEELAKPFADLEVLARITVLKSKSVNYIIFCFHHIIGDGSSGIHFLLRTLHFYDNTKSSEHTIKYLQKNDKLPTPEPKITVEKVCAPNSITKIKGVRIDLDAMHRIECHAKNKGYFLNAYLSEIILQTTFIVFEQNQYTVSMPIDLRKRNKNNRYFPLKFHTSCINFEASNNITAKAIQSKIREAFRKKQYIENLSLLNNMINQRTSDLEFSKLFISKAPALCISNAGVIDTASIQDSVNASLQLVEFHLSVNAQSYMGTAESFTVQLTQLENQGLFININYPFPLISEEKMSYFLNRLEQELLSI